MGSDVISDVSSCSGLIGSKGPVILEDSERSSALGDRVYHEVFSHALTCPVRGVAAC